MPAWARELGLGRILIGHRQVAGVQADPQVPEQAAAGFVRGEAGGPGEPRPPPGQQPVLEKLHHLPAALQQAVRLGLQVQVDQLALLFFARISMRG